MYCTRSTARSLQVVLATSFVFVLGLLSSSSATGASKTVENEPQGTSAILLFDDFDNTSYLDTNKWSAGSSSFQISNSILTLYSGSVVSRNLVPSDNHILEQRIKVNPGSVGWWGMDYPDVPEVTGPIHYYNGSALTVCSVDYWYGPPSECKTLSSFDATKWHTFKVEMKNGNARMYMDSNLIFEGSTDSSGSSEIFQSDSLHTDYVRYSTGTVNPPSTPTLYNIINSDQDGSYSVSWSSEAGSDNYELQEQKNGSAWNTIYFDSGTSKERNDLADGAWCYRVQAVNSGGASTWTAKKCTTVDTVPPPPPAPTLNRINNDDQDENYTVSWSTVAGAASYELEERLNGGSWNAIYAGSNTSSNRSDQADGEYCYRVRASNDGGDSSWSTVKCATVDTIVSPPPTPTMNGISDSDRDGSYTVSWSTVAGANSYELEERKDGGNWNSLYAGSNTSVNRSNQANGEYCYRVRSSNAGGASNWSTVYCVTVDNTALPPPSPTLDEISNSDRDGTFVVAWSTASSATWYELQEKHGGGDWKSVFSGANTSLNASNLPDGTHCYQVRASNSAGKSSWSESKCTIVGSPPTCYSLTIAINPVTSGTVDTDLESNCGESKFEAGTEITLTAKEADGYRFDHWSGELSGSTNPTKLVISKDMALTVHFSQLNKGGTVNYLSTIVKNVDFFTRFIGPDEQEPNDDYNQANGALISGVTYYGKFTDSNDTDDHFYFFVPEQRMITVRLFAIPTGQDYDLILRNRDLVLFGYSAQLNNSDEFIFKELPSGLYTIQVFNVGGQTDPAGYSLQVVYR